MSVKEISLLLNSQGLGEVGEVRHKDKVIINQPGSVSGAETGIIIAKGDHNFKYFEEKLFTLYFCKILLKLCRVTIIVICYDAVPSKLSLETVWVSHMHVSIS